MIFCGSFGIKLTQPCTKFIMENCHLTLEDLGQLDTHHNDAQLKDAQHNDTHLKDAQHNDIEHSDIQHNDIQHNNIQHNDIKHNIKMLRST